MRIQTVVHRSNGVNSSLVEIQDEKGNILTQLDVNVTLNNITVKTTLFDGNQHTFKQDVSDLSK